MVFTIREDEDTNVSGNGTTTLKIDIPQNVTFRIRKIVAKYTGNFKITRLYDAGAKKDYLVGNLHETHFNEENGKTLIIDPPIEIRGATSLKVDITDTSGSTNAIHLAFIGDEQ